ncbi:hypothetical protein EJ03DRAFT_292530 [Teratosphaeria nubilosa]|uniref:UROD/MetE-like protein n=1 Tax=Teratosphaeria nubilosa TaxID=161662 RepID=A0A6G1LB24_9PEZI|nr:hypothetical protein EJ03DRAFT_292530 [Teratosphaeria nubilosa]
MAPTSPTSALFIGSVPLSSAEEVFTTLSTALPEKTLPRIPDGEIGARNNFTLFQAFALAGTGKPQILKKGPGEGQRWRDFTSEEVEETMKDFPEIQTGYDTYAMESYKAFAELKKEGKIPSTTKFQVGIPTPASVVGPFVQPAFQPKIYPLYMAALERAIKNIQAQIPHDQLALQLDLAIDFALLHGQNGYEIVPVPITYMPDLQKTEEVKQQVLGDILRLANLVEPDVELGFHFCYGDLGKSHFFEPPNTGMVAEVGQTLVKELKRDIAWLHFAVPKARTDEEYLKPFAEKLLPVLGAKTEVYVGLVHEYDLEGTKARLKTAKKVLGERPFGVSTECGLGRRNAEDLKGVLEIERAVLGL